VEEKGTEVEVEQEVEQEQEEEEEEREEEEGRGKTEEGGGKRERGVRRNKLYENKTKTVIRRSQGRVPKVNKKVQGEGDKK
jgi:hypothetical protein